MMNKIRNKRVTIFGKTISAILLASFLIGGIASAALLTYYGVIKTTATVEQSILVDGHKWNELITETIPESAPGGETFCWLHKIENQASIDIPVKFEMSCEPECGGITKSVYEVPEETTLILENKGTNWQAITGDGIQATLVFDTVSPTFDYTLTVTDLIASTQYALIYKPDKTNRFVDWNGAGGKVITTFTTDAGGDWTETGSIDLGVNLPDSTLPDWNINPIPDYCGLHNTWDSYAHCKGAKIWIVPTSDLTSGALPLIAWNPSKYLFETDLITYLDCDFLAGPEFAVDMVKGNSITTLNTKTKTTIPVLICYGFDKLIAPGIYTITTNVIPS